MIAAGTSYNDPVNTNVHLLDAAVPGTLPVLDHRAVRLSLKTALALDCKVVSDTTRVIKLKGRTVVRLSIVNITFIMIFRALTKSLSTTIH
jgi:hypothetical protein